MIFLIAPRPRVGRPVVVQRRLGQPSRLRHVLYDNSGGGACAGVWYWRLLRGSLLFSSIS